MVLSSLVGQQFVTYYTSVWFDFLDFNFVRGSYNLVIYGMYE